MSDRLELRKPIIPFIVTQAFGDDLTCVDTATRSVCMGHAKGESCAEGFESLYLSAGLKGHNGIDLAAAHGQPVFAATDGVVREATAEKERGIGLAIISRRRFVFDTVETRGRRYYAKTRYWHLLSLAVRDGDEVTAGQLIGWADNTGLSAGTHLHFELKPVSRGFGKRFRNAFGKNGYRGAIDPSPYFID